MRSLWAALWACAVIPSPLHAAEVHRAELVSPESAVETFKLIEGKKTSLAIFDLLPSGVSKEVASSLTQVLSVEVTDLAEWDLAPIDGWEWWKWYI